MRNKNDKLPNLDQKEESKSECERIKNDGEN